MTEGTMQAWCEVCGITEALELRQLVQPEEGQMTLCPECWEEYRKLRGLVDTAAQEARRVAVTRSRVGGTGLDI